ncbi:MAG: transporter substrate-binding protein [Paenibacillaceae bacterium]|jgi:ABC-type amino acid transport substrate-binding protein|nr:transporter substrate-binding protein [Paenibacillaceae bacterium]
MMKQMVRTKSLLLACSMAALLAAGCSQTEKADPAPAAATPAPSITASAPAAVSPQIEEIKKKGKLVIATGDYYPFEYLDPDTKKLVGYDIDLGQKIADKIGVPVEWKEMQFTALIPSVQNGQADMAIAAMYITDERKQAVDMSDSYLGTGMSLVKLSGDSSVNSINDLDGKTVGVKAGATSEKAANDLVAKGTKLKVVSYKDTTDYLLDLQLGRVDVAFNDYVNQMGYNKQHREAKLEIVGDPFIEADLGLAVKKGNAGLLQLANDVIKELQANGQAQELYDKWLK